MESERPTIPEALLAEERWLSSLARGLVGDPAEADDAAQETWLVAAMRPPGTGDSPRGWLATVLRHRLRDRRRERVRRSRRERAIARTEAVEATVDAAAREEMKRLLAAAARRLPEPFRETVFLRYFDGLPCETIALRLGVPSSTVRNRLARAHARIRADLDGGAGGSSRSTLVALALACPRNARAAVLLRTAIAAGAIAAGVAALALLIPGRPAEERSSFAGREPPAGDAEELADPSGDGRRVEPRTFGSPAPPRIRRRFVRVVDESSRRPIEGALVRIEAGDLRSLQVASLLAETEGAGAPLLTNADGVAPLEESTEPLLVEVRDGARRSRHLILPGETGATIELREERVVEALVIDESGAPVDGVDLVLSRRLGANESALSAARTGRDGRALLAMPAGEPGVARIRFAIPALGDPSPIPSAGAARLVARPSRAVRFRVTEPGGAAIRSGGLELHEPGRPEEALRLRFAGGQAVARIPVGAALTARAWDDGGQWAAAHAPVEGPRADEESPRRHVTMAVRRSLLRGRAVDAAGAPLGGLLLEAVPAGPDAEIPVWGFTGGDGRFELAVDAGAGSIVRLGIAREARAAGAPLPLATVRLPAEAGDVAVASDLLLAEGRVADRSGNPIAGAVLRAAALLDVFGGDAPEAVSDADGRFELRDGAPAGPLFLFLERDGSHLPAPLPFARGERGLRVVAEPAAALLCLAEPGATVDIAALDGAWSVGTAAGSDGRVRLFSLPPGEALLKVASGGRPREDRVRLEAGRVLEFDARASAARGVLVTVRGEHGTPPVAICLFVRDPSGWTPIPVDAEGRAETGRPGPVEILAVAPGRRSARATLERDGEIRLDSATPATVRVTLTLPEGTRPALGVDLVRLADPGEPPDEERAEQDPRNLLAPPRAAEPDAPIALEACDPGVYRVRIWLLLELDDETRAIPIETGAAPFELAARGETLVVPVDLSAAALAEAHRALASELPR